MDTVEFAVPNREERAYLERCIVRNADKGSLTRLRRIGQHKRGLAARIHGKAVSLIMDAQYDFGHEGRFSVHLSQFQNQTEFDAWQFDVTQDIGCAWDRWDLLRLDFCVDVALPPTTIQDCITQPNAHYARYLRSDTATVVFGKGKKRTHVYEKELPLSDFDFVPDQLSGYDSDSLSIGTRIEVQRRKGRLPIQRLCDFRNLWQTPMFSHLKWTTTDPVPFVANGGHVSYKIGHYFYRANTVGAHQAKKEINHRSKSFHRDIGSKLGRLDVVNLEELKLKRLERFFGHSSLLSSKNEKNTFHENQFFDNLGKVNAPIEGRRP